MYGCVLIEGNIIKFSLRKWNVVWNIEIIAISEINKVSVSLYFVFEDQII